MQLEEEPIIEIENSCVYKMLEGCFSCEQMLLVLHFPQKMAAPCNKEGIMHIQFMSKSSEVWRIKSDKRNYVSLSVYYRLI